MLAISNFSIAQNNPYAKVAYTEVACSDPLHISHSLWCRCWYSLCGVHSCHMIKLQMEEFVHLAGIMPIDTAKSVTAWGFYYLAQIRSTPGTVAKAVCPQTKALGWFYSQRVVRHGPCNEVMPGGMIWLAPAMGWCQGSTWLDRALGYPLLNTVSTPWSKHLGSTHGCMFDSSGHAQVTWPSN